MKINKKKLLNLILEAKKSLDEKAMNKIDKALIRFFRAEGGGAGKDPTIEVVINSSPESFKMTQGKARKYLKDHPRFDQMRSGDYYDRDQIKKK
jgi:hypothetical protein